VTIPGADPAALRHLLDSSAVLGLLDLFSGGGLSTFGIVALGLNPYVNATIVMQLMTVVSERVKELSREGEAGRRRINRWTRYLTVAFGAGQAYGLTVLFQSSNPSILPATLDWFTRLLIIVVLTAGSVILMWFGELITEQGIGNGVSMLILAGIVARAPQTIGATVEAAAGSGGLLDLLPPALFAVITVLATALVIEFQQAFRKVPIQSAQRSADRSRTTVRRASFLPIRINSAGVIPIIFALSVMSAPTILGSYFTAAPADSWWHQAATWLSGNFAPDGPNLVMDVVYNGIYFGLIVGFTFFYTAITFDVDEVADQLRRHATFVPGIRPGPPTAAYLGEALSRVTLVGGLFLGFITVLLPLVAGHLTHVPSTQLYLGGTTILIVVGVALDTARQLETQLVMRRYRGFIR
jgi:preprotein translocase subunit SecY